MEQRSTRRIGRNTCSAAVAVLAVAATAMTVAPVAGQAEAESEAVMIAAARWAASQVPGESVRLDPHRTGRSTDGAVVARIAAALGAELGTLEQTRECVDPMTPSSCRLSVDKILAVSVPRSRGELAEVRVYVWYRQASTREPVARQSWDLTMRRTGEGWQVEGQRARY